MRCGQDPFLILAGEGPAPPSSTVISFYFPAGRTSDLFFPSLIGMSFDNEMLRCAGSDLAALCRPRGSVGAPSRTSNGS